MKLTPMPKGFRCWYDRWETHSWVWREKADSPHVSDPETDLREGTGHGSRREAREAILAEIEARAHRGRVAAN